MLITLVRRFLADYKRPLAAVVVLQFLGTLMAPSGSARVRR
jgi:hypothetical protein